MLNVPETVKALFKADGIRKNFRVHFPGGELPDITNENIVQESVKFTESLCSQDVLKFGLTEASVIEFETVGVANMYGMTIEAGIEIDLSSLSAAEIAEIAAGSWDGVYVSETDTDIGFPFFRVPYGVFRVESCPRDHQAMTHRRVQAYGFAPNRMNENPFEAKKRNTLNLPESYAPDMFKLLLESAAYNLPKTMAKWGYSQSDVNTSIYLPTGSNSQFLRRSIQLYSNTGTSIAVTTTVYCYSGYTEGNGTASSPRKLENGGLFEADLHGVNYFSILSDLATALENSSLNIDLERSGFSSWLALAKACLTDAKNGYSFLYPGVGYYPQHSLTGDHLYSKVDIEQSNPIVYPHVGTFSGVISAWQVSDIYEAFVIPYYYQVVGGVGDTPILNYTIPAANRASFRHYIPSEQEPSLVVNFPQTQSGDLYVGLNGGSIKTTGFSYGGNYNTPDIVNGYMEMLAQFGKTNRQGEFDTLRLSNEAHVPVPPSQYSSFWWDEYDVLPIGTIRFNYQTENSESGTSENASSYEFGDGESIYDMTDNNMIKNLTGATQDSIETMLEEMFIPNLGPIAFTPVDLDMKGLPYLEAGDFLSVTAGDGVTAYSFAMRQEISGVQVLEAHVESTSGDIIESGESE